MLVGRSTSREASLLLISLLAECVEARMASLELLALMADTHAAKVKALQRATGIVFILEQGPKDARTGHADDGKASRKLEASRRPSPPPCVVAMNSTAQARAACAQVMKIEGSINFLGWLSRNLHVAVCGQRVGAQHSVIDVTAQMTCQNSSARPEELREAYSKFPFGRVDSWKVRALPTLASHERRQAQPHQRGVQKFKLFLKQIYTHSCAERAMRGVHTVPRDSTAIACFPGW